MASIGTEQAYEFAARARRREASGSSVIHLEIGEPDVDTAANVRQAAKDALDHGATHYAPYSGIPELRSAIAADTTLRKAFPVSPEQVFVTVGGKGVILYSVLATVDPGGEVLMLNPGYPTYDSVVRFVGGVSVGIPLRGADEFRLDANEFASYIGPRTRLIILNSPANPTGRILSRSDLERVAELAQRHNCIVLSDEIYSQILYDGTEHVSIASLDGMAERTIVLDGFSKTFAMTGWRLGYAIVPPWLNQAFGRLIINSVGCASTFPQVGALEALRSSAEFVRQMVTEFHERRQLIIEGLNSVPGLTCPWPEGAFYAFPNVSGTGLSGADFADRLFDVTGVCTLPGSAFGVGGQDHIRISFANSKDNLFEALQRIRHFVDRLP